MNYDEVRYFADNIEKMMDELEKILESLPKEVSEKIEECFDEGNNVEEIYNIINKVSPNSGITLSSLKLLIFSQNTKVKDKLFLDEEYKSVLKHLADIYGDRLSEIIFLDYNVNDFAPLLSFNDPKYVEVYRSILKKSLKSVYPCEKVIEILKNNVSVVSEELIINFLENYIHSISGEDAREILKVLPESILQDGLIAKTMVRKISSVDMEPGDAEILNYIPQEAYDLEFVKEILDKFKDDFPIVCDHIPKELRTREIWESICSIDPSYLNQIPNNNIDPTISQVEYTSWLEDLITKIITKRSGIAIEIFSSLDDSKKTTRLCQKLAESISFTSNTLGYNDLLKQIPKSSRTQQLYETLVSKSLYILEDIPLESFIANVTQEQYDRWLENLILNSIRNSIRNIQDIYIFYGRVPRKKINERIWNELLDMCIKQNFDKSRASIGKVEFENITPQMVDRAMKEISPMEVYEVPCIDRNLDELPEGTREIYAKWQSSLSEAQKQAYRKWYEQIWIKFLNETKGCRALYEHMPKEAITAEINRYCIDIDFRSIELMPLPETQEQVQEYQQLLIYALGKIPTIDYKDDRITFEYGDMDILANIPNEYINEEIVRAAIEKSIVYLVYADPNADNFKELVDIAFKRKLASIGRTELTAKEHELIRKFAINNAELFKTLQLEILDPKITSVISESSLERITRYTDVQRLVLNIANDEAALKTFGFALENLKMDNIFIEPLIEKLSQSISFQKTYAGYNAEEKKVIYRSIFLDLVSQRIDRKDVPFTDYEKAIISYLALNPQEGRKITSYDDILTFVERKNSELESIVNNKESTLLEVKNAYLERLVGLNYETVVNLVTMYGNDPEQLLQNYKNISPESFKELSEKEALEIIIKLKSIIETQDIDAIRSEFFKAISQEKKEESFLRYQKSTLLETSLRRAYGRDMVRSLSKNTDSLQTQELEFEGEKYLVRKVSGEFYRMVSLLGAYRKSTTTEGDMYDRWNTSKMASNHALCYSLINQSNPGTAMINDKKGVIISISGFSPESISAEAPYDLRSDNRRNTIFTYRQQRFFSTKNMPNQIRGNYSEYDIEIQDVLSESDKYQKIQPATIICFEEVDEDSIRAAIELGKKLGHPVPIEVIDRRELARTEMVHIIEALNKFKTGENIDPTLVGEIITRFINVRNAHRFSNLSDELIGENAEKENKDAPFNIDHLNKILKECLASIEQKIRNGQVEEGLQALESIKTMIFEERQKAYLMPTMYEKQLWTGIDTDIDYTLDELQRTYGKISVKPLEKIKTLEMLSQIQGQGLSSITFKVERKIDMPEQLSVDQIMQIIDVTKIQEGIAEIHSQGFYQGNKSYDEEHIARVILYSDAISRMEGFDDKTRMLLIEAAKYYSCGRQLDILEKHGQYSAKLAGKTLAGKYSAQDLGVIQATIELQNFESTYSGSLDFEEEKKEKIKELCSKYGISEEQAIIINKMASCISDSIKLDQTRFIDKANDKTIAKSFRFASLELKSSKKMIEFSYLIQEQLAQQELDILSSIVQIDFDKEEEQIMRDFFTEYHLGGTIDKKIKDKSITKSPIVRLEYLKTKHPEIIRTSSNFLSEKKQNKEELIEEKKGTEKLQLDDVQRQNLIRQRIETRISELGIQTSSSLSFGNSFEQHESGQDIETETHRDIKM